MIGAALLFLSATACPAPAPVHAFPGLSMAGPTGMILVPTGQVLKGKTFAFGLHRGAVKTAIGFLDLTEAGILLPDVYDDPNRHMWLNGTRCFIKVGGEFMPGSRFVPGVAAGIENSLARTAGLVGVKSRDVDEAANFESVYAVATWWWSVLGWPLEASIGGGNGRYEGRAFGALTFMPVTFFGHTLKLTGEYAGETGCVGARIALSRNLRLDFAMMLHAYPDQANGGRWTVRIDRGIMGASQSGPISFDFLKRKKKEPGKS